MRISEDGLCSDCEHLVRMDIEQRTRIIEDNKRAAETTLNPASKISKLDIVVEHLDALARYERKGIKTIHDSPSAQLDRSRADLRRLVFRTAKIELKAVLKEIGRQPSPEEKVKTLSEYRLKLESYDPELRETAQMKNLEARVRDSIHRIHLNSALSEAQKAETSGMKAQALRGYKEALKFLNALEIPGPDALRREKIIHSKLSDLAS